MVIENRKMGIILVVDDQPNNLKVISSVIGNEYALSVANSGSKALQILEKSIPDLILLDIMMPEMNGYEVITAIKKDQRLKDIPVIFLTAKTDINDIIQGFDLGAVDYITKPFNIREIKVRIKNHINLAYSRKTILDQKKEIENYNNELLVAQRELEKRNEELVIAHDAIQKHAHEVNKSNQLLLESEYKLRKANKELNKANSEKDKFFSIISHDLRSPFSGLISLLELLKNEMDNLEPEERHDIITSLYQSAKQVYSLLENLLEWSRIQRKAVSYYPEKINVSLLVRNIFSILSAQATAKKIALNQSIPEDITVNADERMISTVFRNLMTNAIKFTYEDGEINFEFLENRDGYLTFSVKDNGKGMSEKIKAGIFQIGSKVQCQGTNQEPGSGLGLVLCKEFIDIHNGKIWVESIEGEGSTFFVSLPA